jgi:hypothetical protein
VRGAIYLDQEPPGSELRRELLAYAGSGGLLVIGPKWGKPEGTLSTRDVHARFSFYSLGKGKQAIAKCPAYGAEMLPALTRMFDQLGGQESLVKGKTVAIKINMVGQIYYRVGHLPPEDTYWTNPLLIGTVVHLMGRAGARRIRVLEGAWSSGDPLMAVMGYDPMADRGTPPFDGLRSGAEACDSTLRLAEELGAGTRDLKRIEVIGTPIREALFSYAALRPKAQPRA